MATRIAQRILVPLVTLTLAAPATAAAQIVVGQTDTFEGTTTEGWIAGNPQNPFAPQLVTTGGPTGAGDGYLLITATGQPGPGSRVAPQNLSQWAQNYLTNGITGITMDVNNMGPTDLFLRLLFADPFMGPPSNIALSLAPVVVAPGSGWQRVFFPIGRNDLLVELGTYEGALSGPTELRLFHNPDPFFAGPPDAIPPVVASLGVDNITAAPEPATVALVAGGLALVGLARRRRRA